MFTESDKRSTRILYHHARRIARGTDHQISSAQTIRTPDRYFLRTMLRGLKEIDGDVCMGYHLFPISTNRNGFGIYFDRDLDSELFVATTIAPGDRLHAKSRRVDYQNDQNQWRITTQNREPMIAEVMIPIARAWADTFDATLRFQVINLQIQNADLIKEMESRGFVLHADGMKFEQRIEPSLKRLVRDRFFPPRNSSKYI